MQSILLVGENPTLQVSRAEILSGALGVGIKACGWAEASEQLRQGHYSVVVLCHSLAGFGEDELIQSAGKCSPEAVFVKILPDYWARRDVPQGVVAVLTGDPEEMVERIGQLLAEMRSRSIPEPALNDSEQKAKGWRAWFRR